MKKKVVIFLAAGILMVAAGKNLIVKNLIAAGVKTVTGLTVKLESVDTGVLKTVIQIRGLKLMANRAQFAEPLVADAPELFIDYDLGAFLKNKIRFEEVKIYLKELIVVRNAKGERNVDMIKDAFEKAPRAKRQEAKKREFEIQKLELKIDKVIYKDYSKGSTPKVTEFNVNINEKFENVTSLHGLISIVMVRALRNTAIMRLAEFDLAPFTSVMPTALQKAAEVTGSAGEAVKSITDTLKNIIPFGK